MPPQNQNLPRPSNLAPDSNSYQLPQQAPYLPPRPKQQGPKLALIFSVLIVAVLVIGLVRVLQKPATDQPLQGAADKVNQENIDGIKAALDSYYAEGNADFGSYPTLVQLNDSDWRGENMSGVDVATLSPTKDRAGLTSSQPSATQYAYQPAPAGCTNTQAKPCNSFTLSALQSSGKLYSVKSVNQ